ncbi:hypothetical protein CYLTODRAFT_484756 [Cylindrobasidium torrendii FP15055 ss-10]|uniref:Uncharacterized protein n=1 Tax=Cylindrobasidium torrendii FP15055 ss-10 TaxID=1314674 RepID=A0A0D7BVI7_9AGAR|nr:hypothetical protein CYLTODRAFT_484756 [Cylindrobasidium torrendii FP15055 ss-10]
MQPNETPGASPLKRARTDNVPTTPSGRPSKRSKRDPATPQKWEAQIAQAIAKAREKELREAFVATAPVASTSSEAPSSSQASAGLSQSSSAPAGVLDTIDEDEQADFWSGTSSPKVEGPSRNADIFATHAEHLASQNEVSNMLREPSLVPKHEEQEEPPQELHHDVTHLSAESEDVLNGVTDAIHKHIQTLERRQAALRRSAQIKDIRIRELEAENRQLRDRQEELNDQIKTMNDTIKIHQQVIKRSYMKPRAGNTAPH